MFIKQLRFKLNTKEEPREFLSFLQYWGFETVLVLLDITNPRVFK